MEYYVVLFGMLLIMLVILRVVGLTFVLGFLLMMVFLLLFENRMLYIPDVPGLPHSPSHNQVGYRSPQDRGLNTKNVSIVTADHLILRGWLVSQSSNPRLVVYFHENSANLGLRIAYLQNLFLRDGSDVLLVAYRGYSDSDGTPSQTGIQLDALAVLDYAISLKRAAEAEGRRKQVYVYGCSLGGAVAIYGVAHFKNNKQIRGLILQNTFTSIGDMVGVLFPYFPFLRLFNNNKWPSVSIIGRIQCPILFIRSLKDKLVPPAHMLALIQNAKRSVDVQSYAIVEGGHSFAWLVDPKSYFQRLRLFFSQIQRNTY